MYNVTLINLAPDARSFVPLGHAEHRGVATDDLVALLRNFCEVDPVENTAADAEIRVQVRAESYLIRTEQKKLILYDAHRRDLPAQIFTVEQAMAELDGSAAVRRTQAILAARAEAAPGPAVPILPAQPAPASGSSTPRVLVMGAAAVTLLIAILSLHGRFAVAGRPAGFVKLGATEQAGLDATLAGVYLTGNEPGQHGIVVTSPGELKLFELGAVEAPRVVYASYQPGRVGPRLCLATDQPGGMIEVTAEGNLTYCGETYQRVP